MRYVCGPCGDSGDSRSCERPLNISDGHRGQSAGSELECIISVRSGFNLESDIPLGSVKQSSSRSFLG